MASISLNFSASCEFFNRETAKATWRRKKIQKESFEREENKR